MRVVVVGAGLGGLCVAAGLRGAGVDVEVMEARTTIDDGGGGYRININPAGHEALRACMTAAQFAAYERTLHPQADPGVYLYSPALRLLARHEAPGAPGAADRGTLRRVLADGLDDRIRFGRRIASVADVGAPDLVVAADGIDSALRRELLPNAGPRSMGWSAIFGRSPLTGANRPWTAPVIRHSRFCGIVDGVCVLALCAYDPPSPEGTEPYVMWVLMGPDDELPARGTPPEGLLAFARDRTAGWDPRATSVLREATTADCFATPLRAMPAVPPIPVRSGVPVAFVGDAVHAMSPAGGEGANTAFGDAALVAHLRGEGAIAEAVARYHAEMRVWAGEALARSARYGSQAAAHA